MIVTLEITLTEEEYARIHDFFCEDAEALSMTEYIKMLALAACPKEDE